MELKPGYKHTEVGVIPDDWSEPLLDTLAKRGSGHTPNKQNHLFWNGDIKWVSLQDTFRLDCLYIVETTQEISKLGLAKSSAVLHPEGTVILSRDAGVGKSAIIKSAMAVSQHFIAWRCCGSLLNTFLYYILQRRKPEFERIAMGSTIKTIGVPYFRSLKIPLPLKKEQEAIAGALSDTDALIEALEQLITKKRHIKQGAMQELLTGKKRLPGFETKPGTQQTEVGEIPADWQLSSFEDVFDFLRSATYSRSNTSSEYRIFYLHYGDIHTKFQNEINFDKNPLKGVSDKLGKGYPFLCEGDLVMADASENMEGVGKSVEVKNIGENKAIAGLHTFLLRPKKSKKLAPGFSGYLQSNPLIIRQQHCLATGMKVFGLSRSNLKMVKIPLPKIAEQEAIAAVLSDMDAEISALETKLTKARHIKQGMMAELLTGRIRLI